jgi:hypothetical protein
MRFRPNLTAVGVNVPLAIAFALTASRGGFGVPLSAALIVVLLVATVWSFPRSRPRSKPQLFVFFTLLGSMMLWTAVLTTVALDPFARRTVLDSILQFAMFGGLALVFVAVLLKYIHAKREGEF